MTNRANDKKARTVSAQDRRGYYPTEKVSGPPPPGPALKAPQPKQQSGAQRPQDSEPSRKRGVRG